jgi:hypothetical protein
MFRAYLAIVITLSLFTSNLFMFPRPIRQYAKTSSFPVYTLILE